MKVLLVSPSMELAGAELVVAELARELGRRGTEVALAAPPGPRDRELAGLPLERFHFADRGRSLLGAAAATRCVRAALGRFEPDIVHAHNAKVTAVSATALRLRSARGRPPLLATHQGVDPAEDRRVARILRRADAVASVSAELARRLALAGCPSDRTSVIPNAVSRPRPLSAAGRRAIDDELGLAGAPVVAAVGRLVPQKAHHRFLEAAATVAAEMPEVRFLLVGEGPLRPELERQAERLSLDRRVTFTGVRSDARDLIARSSLVVFCSEWEGLSLAALEALAAGVPLVSTPAEGMAELLSTGAGALLPSGDPPVLAERIIALLRAPEQRAEMGRIGAALAAERYSPESMVDAYLELYAQLTQA